MTTQPEVSLTGRAPTSPIDSYLVDATVPSGLFTRAIVGTVAGFTPALQGEVSVGVSGNVNYALPLRGVVNGASGATIGQVCPLSLETYITDAPTGMHVMMRFNTDASKDTPDAWFMSNKHAVAYDNGDPGTVLAGSIKVKITGANLLSTIGRILVYQEN